jgi:prepilin-type processing-associated H-X9-DG protein/prepilin-type N-terminal cleavage/methylation domain-containing protein
MAWFTNSKDACAQRRTCSGFTLVELLTVIGIVSVLAALMAPGVLQALQYAWSVECQSNLRQLGIAAIRYESDHGTLPPYSMFDPAITNMSGGKGVNVRWCWSDDTPGDPMVAFCNGFLAPYLGNCTDIAGCPVFDTPDDIVSFYRRFGLSYPVAVHYGYNGLLLGERHENFYASDPSTPGYRTWVGYCRGQLKAPGMTAMFADSGTLVNGQVVPSPTVYPPLTVKWPNGSDRARPGASVHGRHPGGRANVAWADGHVSSEVVCLYDGQPEAERSAKLGFLAPDPEKRSNEWMVAK